MMKIGPSNHPPQLNDFCRICLLRKAQLRPLSSLTETVMIPEMIYKLTGTMLNMNEQLPRVICKRCLDKLELAFAVSEEFRKQEELLRSLWWKGALVDQLMAYGKECRQKPHSEEVIERLKGKQREPVPPEAVPELQQDQASVGSDLVDLDEEFGIAQEDTIQPVEQRGTLVEPESLDASVFKIEFADDDEFEEDSSVILEEQSTEQLHDIPDNGLEMVLELEDLQTIGALPLKLLEQLDRYGSPADETAYTATCTDYVLDLDDFFLPTEGSEPEHSKHDNDKDHASNGEDPDDDSGPPNPNLADDDFHPDLPRVAAKKRYWHEKGDFECSVCKMVLPSRHTLYVHTKGHIEVQFQCVKCRKPFESQEELDVHELSHQDELGQDKGKFQCQYCQKRFPWISRLRKHVARHEKLRAAGKIERNLNGAYKCHFCEKRFAEKGRFKAHMQKHDDVANGRFVCKTCGHSFSGKTELMRHERKHETDPEWMLAREKMTPPIEVTKNDKTMYKCGECQNMYASRFRYFQHIQRHIVVKVGLHQCQDCGKRYKIKKHLRHHQRTVHKLFIKAEPDGEEKATEYETGLNDAAEPAPVDIGKRLPYCGECDAYFLNLLNYGVHMRVHEGVATEGSSTTTNQEPSVSLKTPGTVAGSTPSWYCNECGATFSSYRSLNGHQRRHTDLQNLKFKCNLCKIAFSAHYELSRHRTGTHGLDPRVNASHDPATRESCPLCNKSVRKKRLVLHVKQHENIHLKRYVCKKCGTPFGASNYMKAHVAAKTCEQSRYVPKPAQPLSASSLAAYFLWEEQRKPIPGSAVNVSTQADAVTLMEMQDDGSFRCKTCHKTFKGFTSAAAHSRRHKIMEAGSYKCKIGPKEFDAKKSEQELHMKSVQ